MNPRARLVLPGGSSFPVARFEFATGPVRVLIRSVNNLILNLRPRR